MTDKITYAQLEQEVMSLTQEIDALEQRAHDLEHEIMALRTELADRTQQSCESTDQIANERAIYAAAKRDPERRRLIREILEEARTRTWPRK
jgi:predicted  nucleic acid-binding Zn-ribbon protein